MLGVAVALALALGRVIALALAFALAVERVKWLVSWVLGDRLVRDLGAKACRDALLEGRELAAVGDRDPVAPVVGLGLAEGVDLHVRVTLAVRALKPHVLRVAEDRIL